MKYTCPVCGYPELPWEPNYFNCFEICPSCRFQFSVTDRDRGFTYEQWRQQWIASGLKWNSKGIKPPANWSPKQQLLNIGIKI